MQAEITQSEVIFQPVTITMVLNSEQEVQALTTLCNYSPIVDAARKSGIDISSIFDAMPAGFYNPETWNDDVQVLAEALSNHPGLALNRIDIDRPAVETPVEIATEDQLVQAVSEFLTPFDDVVDDTVTGITCEIVNVSGDRGDIKVSDGRMYKYNLEGCGQAISIKTMAGSPITEVPTSKYGTSKLQPTDIEVIEAVLSQIS